MVTTNIALRKIHNVAIHEAGHAVMCLINKVPFESVSLRAGDRGAVEGIRVSDKIIQAQITIGGSVAELILEGKVQQVLSSGRFDLQLIDGKEFNQELKSIVEAQEEIMPLQSWLFVRVASQLMRRWNVVQAIATELEKKGTLSYQEVYLILGRFVR